MLFFFNENTGYFYSDLRISLQMSTTFGSWKTLSVISSKMISEHWVAGQQHGGGEIPVCRRVVGLCIDHHVLEKKKLLC